MGRFVSEAESRAFALLEQSIAGIDGRLGDDRDWIRCKRLIRRLLKIGCYPWVWLPLLPYSEYLQTEHWKRLRQAAYERAANKCQVCNGGGELQTHHRTYENIGNERMDDLIVLCDRCHSLFHENCKLASEEA